MSAGGERMGFNKATDIMMYGASDDLFECEGVHSKEYGAHSDNGFVATVTDAGGKGLIATWRYGGAGVWSVEVAMLDEGVEIPWALSLSDGRGAAGTRHQKDAGYSMALIIHDCAGANVVVKRG